MFSNLYRSRLAAPNKIIGEDKLEVLKYTGKLWQIWAIASYVSKWTQKSQTKNIVQHVEKFDYVPCSYNGPKRTQTMVWHILCMHIMTNLGFILVERCLKWINTWLGMHLQCGLERDYFYFTVLLQLDLMWLIWGVESISGCLLLSKFVSCRQ